MEYEDGQYAIAVRKDDTGLSDALNGALEALNANGKLDALVQKRFAGKAAR